MTTAAIRSKLYDYIRVADDKKLHAIYNLLEGEIEKVTEWWEDKEFILELDRRDRALETGEDKGTSLEEMTASINKLRQKKYGK